jgi:ABC-type uncharacterized transport system permease subunit
MLIKPVFQFLEARPGRAAVLLLVSLVAVSYLSIEVLFPATFSTSSNLLQAIFVFVCFLVITYNFFLCARFFNVAIGQRSDHLEEIYENIKRFLGA